MLGYILAGLVAAVAVTSIVLYIHGMITESKAREAVRDQGVQNAFLEVINNCGNQVSLRDFESGTEYKLKGDSVSSEMYIGRQIYV